jgi:small subunit ribosomal protein S8e
MALWQGDSKRTKTGRRIRYARGKKKFEIGRERHLTTIGPTTLKKVRTKGGNSKTRAKTTNVAYVVDPENKKTTKTEIVSVVENKANIHYVRRNIINKGAIIETKLGKAKVTSRPGQSGIINAILVSK